MQFGQVSITGSRVKAVFFWSKKPDLDVRGSSSGHLCGFSAVLKPSNKLKNGHCDFDYSEKGTLSM